VSPSACRSLDVSKQVAYIAEKIAQVVIKMFRSKSLGKQFRRCCNFAIGSTALFAVSCSIANAESFSIKCIYGPGAFHVSFDTESGKVVEETLSGSPLKGRIDKIERERIDFHVAIPGRPDMDIVWDGSEKILTILAIPGDKYRTGNVIECAATELRSMLSKYDSMP
jgi:hypothetical protein